MFYNPAVVIGRHDMLVEPFGDNSTSISELSFPGIDKLKEKLKSNYIKWVKSRVISIVKAALSQEVKILVFPEYSIPAQILSEIIASLAGSDMIVVAGSHMITSNCANLPKGYPESKYIKHAISPILSKDGMVGFVFKHNAAAEEMGSLATPATVNYQNYIDNGISLAIRICIDAISNDTRESISSDTNLVAVPSLSKNTDAFSSMGDLSKYNELPVLYANGAHTGGSSVYAAVSKKDPHWFLSQPLNGKIPSDTEGMIVANIDLDYHKFAVGTVKAAPPANIDSVFNFIYLKNPSHKKCYDAIASVLVEGSESFHYNKIEYMLDKLYSDKLRAIKSDSANGVLTNESLANSLRCVSFNTPDKKAFQKEQAELVLNCLSSSIAKANGDGKYLHDMGIIAEWLSECKNGNDSSIIGEDAKLFFGRDKEKVEIARFINSKESGLIIKGLRGIGKTKLLSKIESEILPESTPWKTIIIKLEEGVGYELLLDTIEYELNISYTEKKGVDPQVIAKRYLDQACSISPTIIEIDDLHLLTEANGRFADQSLEAFILALFDVAKSTPRIKIVVTTNRNIPVLHDLKQLVMSQLSDNEIKQIIEYCYRNRTHSIEPLNISDETLQYVYGNPLAAIIVSQLVEDDKLFDIESRGGTFERFQEQQMKNMLGEMEFSDSEREIISIIAVAKKPVHLEFFRNSYPHLISSFENLYSRMLLEHNEGMLSIHPIFQNYYYNQLDMHKRVNYHKRFSEYFEEKFDSYKTREKRRNPVVLSNLIYHLGGSLQREKLFRYKAYLDEILPVAFSLYRDKNYEEALKYFEIIREHSKERTDILIKMAQCCVYIGQIERGDKYFELAIASNPRGAYLYASYSITLSGKSNYIHAEKLAIKAQIVHTEYGNSLPWELAIVKFAYARSIFHKSPKLALEYYEEACKLESTNVYYRCMYGKNLILQGCKDEGIKELKKAGQIKPNDPLYLRFKKTFIDNSTDKETMLLEIEDETDDEPTSIFDE
jgi:tetratricopeptide (TPR) repeat protein